MRVSKSKPADISGEEDMDSVDMDCSPGVKPLPIKDKDEPAAIEPIDSQVTEDDMMESPRIDDDPVELKIYNGPNCPPTLFKVP